MRMQDLAIRAINGDALVKGQIRMEGDTASPLPCSAPGQLIGVDCRRSAFGHTMFSLFGRTERCADGFYGASQPVLEVKLREAVPDLFSAIQNTLKDGRLRTATESLPVVSVAFENPSAAEEEMRLLFAEGSELDLALTVTEHGLRITFTAVVGPSTLVQHTPVFETATVTADLILPTAYCHLQGFSLPAAFPYSNRQPVGGWRPTSLGLESIAASVFGGSPFCPGTLNWKDKSGLHRPTGPFVLLFLDEHDLTARPAGQLNRLANGFAEEANFSGSGPEMKLATGYGDWARMLENSDRAEIVLAGSGIGHVDGRTGRAAYEDGALRQAITRLRLNLERTREGLRVRGDGELAPLPDAYSVSLGPELQFDFLVPRAWILARGLKLPRFREDRGKEFPGDGTW